MDRDRSENVIDPEERSTPTTGESFTGESGDARARESEKQDEEDEDDDADPEPLKTPLPPD